MIAERIELNIAREFTDTPGPRYRAEGDYSGEEFRESLLCPRYTEARHAGGVLHVNLDGAVGYPTSFLEEAFGGLARIFGPDEVRQHIEITCTDEPYLVQDILEYIQNANRSK